MTCSLCSAAPFGKNSWGDSLQLEGILLTRDGEAIISQSGRTGWREQKMKLHLVDVLGRSVMWPGVIRCFGSFSIRHARWPGRSWSDLSLRPSSICPWFWHLDLKPSRGFLCSFLMALQVLGMLPLVGVDHTLVPGYSQDLLRSLTTEETQSTDDDSDWKKVSQQTSSQDFDKQLFQWLKMKVHIQRCFSLFPVAL